MDDIQNAIRILKDGGIVIYPTDTAFGIGCRIDRHDSVDKLFAIRNRPRSMATPVLVDSMEMALSYYSSPANIVRRLMREHWPGALTIIAHCRKNLIYSPIRGGGGTVGLRMPNHQTALALIRGVGVPIIGTSANFHGMPTPYTFSDLDPELVKLADAVVPGACSVGLASTVVDCSTHPYIIVRQGSVTLT